jgi:hypothetical protein
VRAGDLLQFERWYDQGLSYLPGEVIPVTLVRDGATLHAEITAAGRPIENLDRWHFLLNAALCGLGTLFGLVIGLRQAEVRTSRALALAFLWWSLNLGRSYADPVWPLVFVQLTYWIALVPGWYSGRRVGAAACAACCRCSWWPWCRWNWWQWGWPWAGCRRAYSIGSRHRTSVLRAR